MNEPRIFKEIVDELSKLELLNVNSDIKGDAFEYFISKSSSTEIDFGEYFTPRHIIKFMVKFLNPKFGEKIYDPFCGTGGMLIEAFKHIFNSMTTNNPDSFNFLREKTIYGSELTSTSRIAKMNMILIGDGHSNIIKQNTWDNPINHVYDVIISNIPFGLQSNSSKYYDIDPNSKLGNSTSIQHILKALKCENNSRAGFIVPKQILFDNNYIRIRKYLIENFGIRIISLPQGVFLPYTDVETCIIFIDKSHSKILYKSITNDGFTLNKERKKVDGENELEQILIHKDNFLFFDEIEKSKLDDNYQLIASTTLSHKNGYVKISDILTRHKEVISINNDEKYKRVTIQMNGKGLLKRDEIFGKEIGTKKQFIIRKGQLLLSKIDAHNGAFGIVPKELDGAIITGNFWSYNINHGLNFGNSIVDIFSSHLFTEFCKKNSFGSTNRKYLREENFLNSYIKIPNNDDTKKILTLKKEIEKLKNEISKNIDELKIIINNIWDE